MASALQSCEEADPVLNTTYGANNRGRLKVVDSEGLCCCRPFDLACEFW